MFSCTSGFHISKSKNRADNILLRYKYITYSHMYGYFFICSSLFKLRDCTMMSNANTEYNVLVVLPRKAGVVSWLTFRSFSGSCSL